MSTTSLLPAGWTIPQVLRDRLGANVGRQRTMVADGHLLLVLHAPPRLDDDARIGRFFWRTPDGTWSSNELGTGINALNKHLDEYESVIAKLDRQEEVATTADDYFQVLERLAPIHRAVRNLHQALQNARKTCPDYRDIIDVRDRAYAIERAAELLFTGTKNSLDFTVAKRAEEQSKSSERMAVAAHRLNILAAFFFPIATLTAILGVDFVTLATIFGLDADNVESKGPYLTVFGAVVLVGLVLGAMIAMIVTRPSKHG